MFPDGKTFPMTSPTTALAWNGSMVDSLSRAQFRRRLAMGLAAVAAAFGLLFVASTWRLQSSSTFYVIQAIGLALIVVAIAGRTWCAVYIGGRKKITLVQEGPYAMVRHPLYSFSIIGAAGIGALWGSFVVSLMLAVATALILKGVTRQEEQFLATRFGTEYTRYAAQVGRYIPRSFCWRKESIAPINHEVAMRTFIQSSFFLLGVPVAAFAQWGQISGFLPILVLLP
jgi:protein-S-isoprenylcysteine O-methyltransferase Ste14